LKLLDTPAVFLGRTRLSRTSACAFAYGLARDVTVISRRLGPFVRAVLLVVAVMLSVQSAVARTEDTSTSGVLDTLYTVPTIVVEAPRVTRTEFDVFKRSGFVAVIDMGERRNRVEDLPSVLSRMVGVRVRQYGGLGGFATVSIRGSSSNQVDVFLDGVPLADPYTGVTNIGDLPLGGVQSIEVFRGFTPPHLGSSAIGGAVNLNTMNSDNWSSVTLAPRVEALGSYGSFDTSRLVFSLWSRLSALRLFAHAGHLTSAGNFTYVDEGLPEDLDDDREVERANNDIDSWNALGRLFVELPFLGNVSLSHNFLEREQGVPGIGTRRSLTARSKRERHLTYLRIEPPATLSTRLTISATGFYSWANEIYSDPDGDIALNAQGSDNVFSTLGGTFRSRLGLPLVPLELELYLDGKNEKFHPEATLPLPTVGPDRLRTSTTAVLSGDLFLHRLNLVLSAAGRALSHTSEFYDPPLFPWLPPTPQGEIRRSDYTPQFGFRFLASSFLTVKGNWGRYVRLPTFVELFGNTGSVTGSAILKPEEALNRDIGVVLSHGGLGRFHQLFFEMVYLDNKVENLILFFPNSQFTSKPRNIGAARIRGVEMSMSSFVGDRLRVAGNYTYLDSRDTSPITYYNGNELPARPKHDVGAFVDVFLKKWKFSYELHHIGANYLNPANHKSVPARDIHNISAQWRPFANGVSLSAEARNISDNQISDVNGFPLPGRSMFITLGYQPH
jgi:outer membrane cobalamin receptor